MEYPLWATPSRRRQLVETWLEWGNRCLLGHSCCFELSHYLLKRARLVKIGVAVQLPVFDPETDLPKPGVYFNTFKAEDALAETLEWVGGVYFVKEEALIEDWKTEDRLERSITQKREQRLLHAAPLKRLWHRGDGFDAIARDAYLANRPTFRVLAVGVHAFTQQRVAKVEITALEKTIWVNISGAKLSKNKLRKLFRRGDVPEEIYSIIEQRIRCYL